MKHSIRKQLNAEKIRIKKQQELEAAEANWKRICSLESGIKPKYAATVLTDKSVKQTGVVSTNANVKRTQLPKPVRQAQPVRVYSGEMLQRELKAQAEIKLKQKRVAILVNKGAYQYITPETDLATLGRK